MSGLKGQGGLGLLFELVLYKMLNFAHVITMVEYLRENSLHF